MRPSDWQVLDLDRDPTPGEPYRIGVLARSASRLGEDAAAAERDVRSLAGDGAVLSWMGLAGEAFRGALDDFPGQLAKLADSYEQAGAALTAWAADLDGAQSQADRALALGRQARAELAVLTGQLSSAQSAAGSASAGAQRLQDVGAGAPPPDPAQVAAAVRNASAAAGRVSALSGQVSDAQGRLDAAKRMAADARSVRDSAGDRAAERLHEASEAGIEPNSFWEDFKGAAARVWDVAVKVATAVAIVVAVIALFVGGPLVWGILLAASLVLLADSIAKYAGGEGSIWMVGLNLLGVIPGGRLLTGLGRIAGLSRVGTRAMAAGSRGLAAGSRGLAAARTSLGNAAAGIRNGLGQRLAVMGGETGSASLELLTGGLSRLFSRGDDIAAATDQYADDLIRSGRTRPTTQDGPAYDYQRARTGDMEYDISPDPAHHTWADGINRQEGLAQDAKYRMGDSSFYDPPSLPAGLRDRAIADMDNRLLSYRDAISSSDNPLRGLEIITNDPRAAQFIAGRMDALGVPGVVRVVP